MKVNLDGRGVLPGIGLLPIRGKELSKDEILRLLNFNVRIYDANTGAIITGPEFFNVKPPAPAPVAKKPEPIKEVEVPMTVTEEKIAEPDEPLPEIQETEPVPYVEPEIEVIPEEEIPMEIHIDAAPAEDVVVETPIEAVEEDAVEEAPVEDAAPQQNNNYRPYNGKKKKHR